MIFEWMRRKQDERRERNRCVTWHDWGMTLEKVGKVNYGSVVARIYRCKDCHKEMGTLTSLSGEVKAIDPLFIKGRLNGVPMDR